MFSLTQYQKPLTNWFFSFCVYASYPWSFQETHKYYKDHCNIICISVICFFLCLPLSRACVDLPRWVDLFRTIEEDFARVGILVILWLYFTMSIALWAWLSSWTPRQNFSCHLPTAGMGACAATAQVFSGEHQQVPVHAACTKTRSNATKPPKRNDRNGRNDQNEITKKGTSETTNTNSVNQE